MWYRIDNVITTILCGVNSIMWYRSCTLNRYMLYISKGMLYESYSVTMFLCCSFQNGTESTETFDAVLVCTGHHADKNIPHFQGQESFTGKMIHSHDYKDQRGYEDQNIVVVGIGNSGVDIAVELGRVGKQVGTHTLRKYTSSMMDIKEMDF